MKKCTKKLLVILSFLFVCNLLSSNTFALNNTNIDNISEFLSTCQIQSNKVWISNSIPTYRDDTKVNDDINYLIFLEESIIGILTNTEGVLTYTDLTTKSINNYKFENIRAIEYTDLDTIIYLDDIAYSIIDNDFISLSRVNYELFNLNIQEVNLHQTRASSKYLNVPKYQQDTSYTCWATCIASVAKYKGKPYTTPSTISRNHGIDPNTRGATIGETKLAMSSQFGIQSSVISNGPSATELINLINSDKPLITGFLSSTSGHMCIIRGYAEGSSYYTVSYMDPSSATYKTSQIITDRKIQFKVGNITYTSASYLKLS